MKKKQYPIATQITCRGFTLAELVVTLGVLALLIIVMAQMVNTAATTMRPANKRIDTDTQARVVLDRMAVDFAKMLKRTDVDYYVKAPSGYKNPKAHGKGLKLNKGQLGNDQMAFFSEVPGYYPSVGSQSPLSLVAYRLNENTKTGNPTYLMLERMGKGLLWNGVNNGTTGTSPYPIIFATGQIDSTCTNKCICNGTTGPWAGPWSAAICNDSSSSSDDPAGSYETIGPGVFRFEYYYLLKDGSVSDTPRLTSAPVNWGNSAISLSAKLNAFCDVEAIALVIAVIDPASRALAGTDALFNLMSDLPDFATAHGNGYGNQKKTISSLESTWNGTLFGDATLGLTGIVNTGQTSDGSPFPPEAAKGVRIYNRYIDVRTLPDF